MTMADQSTAPVLGNQNLPAGSASPVDLMSLVAQNEPHAEEQRLPGVIPSAAPSILLPDLLYMDLQNSSF